MRRPFFPAFFFALLSFASISCDQDPSWNVLEAQEVMPSVPREREVHPPEFYVDGYTFTDAMEKIPIADLRRITLFYEDGISNEFMVYVLHVDRLVEAQLTFHNKQGNNPITAISFSSPHFSGPYWWSTPSLSGDPIDYQHGAMVIHWTVYKHQTLNAESGWQIP